MKKKSFARKKSKKENDKSPEKIITNGNWNKDGDMDDSPATSIENVGQPSNFRHLKVHPVSKLGKDGKKPKKVTSFVFDDEQLLKGLRDLSIDTTPRDGQSILPVPKHKIQQKEKFA